MSDTERDRRAAYVFGLTALAALLDENPELPIPSPTWELIAYPLYVEDRGEQVMTLFDLADLLGVDVMESPGGRFSARLECGGGLVYELAVPRPEPAPSGEPRVATRPGHRIASAGTEASA